MVRLRASLPAGPARRALAVVLAACLGRRGALSFSLLHGGGQHVKTTTTTTTTTPLRARKTTLYYSAVPNSVSSSSSSSSSSQPQPEKTTLWKKAALLPSSSPKRRQKPRRGDGVALAAVTARPPLAEGFAERDDPKGSTARGRELAEKLKNVNLYLVGAMGSGKSRVGDVVCRMLGSYALVDTDRMLESALNCTIADVFKTEGEDAFRDAEAQVLEQVAAYVRLVVSTGGGIVLRQENWASLRTGIVVWLNPTVDILTSRLLADAALKGVADRPLLGNDPAANIGRILDARRELYEQADVTVTVDDAEETPKETAARIVDDVLKFIEENPAKPPPSPDDDEDGDDGVLPRM